MRRPGRMMMVPVEGSEFVLDVELVLIAAGFLGSQDYVTKAFGVNVDGRTNVATEPANMPPTYQMSLPQVICTSASRWWYVPSAREEMWQKRWMNPLWVTRTFKFCEK